MNRKLISALLVICIISILAGCEKEIRTSDHHLYKGDVNSDRQPEGFGISYYTENKKEYEGQWVNGVKQGRGIFYDIDGNISYDGFWENDKRNGSGKSYIFGRLIFEGDYTDDEYLEGTSYMKDGAKYVGQFKDSKRDGKGTLYYSNGDIRYSGEYKNDIAEGLGTLYYPGGNVLYIGEFSNDQPTGAGTIYAEDGTEIPVEIFIDMIKNSLIQPM